MRQEGLLERDGGGRLRFTPDGRHRAAGLIRRHRLAEILFSEKFGMPPGDVEAEACYFEHRLSPAVTEGICSFLGHPDACPHGRSIPPGPCCAPAPR
ncbi:MAG: iron dependent repressor, metal binding and dimerization domain protein [Acidobacteriota bacterium]